MRKAFTKEDIIKKHETNVKAASTALFLPTILGIIYIVRFILKVNLNFYFSLSFTDMLLKLGQEKDAVIISIVISVIYAAAYLALTLLSSKNPRLLPFALALHFFDFCCLLLCMFVLWKEPFNPDWLIDVIFHLFIFVFIIVGIKSDKALKKIKTDK